MQNALIRMSHEMFAFMIHAFILSHVLLYCFYVVVFLCCILCVYCIVLLGLVFMLYCVYCTARYETWFRGIPDFGGNISEGLDMVMIFMKGFSGE